MAGINYDVFSFSEMQDIIYIFCLYLIKSLINVLGLNYIQLHLKVIVRVLQLNLALQGKQTNKKPKKTKPTNTKQPTKQKNPQN